jgi:hypothetical protein
MLSKSVSDELDKLIKFVEFNIDLAELKESIMKEVRESVRSEITAELREELRQELMGRLRKSEEVTDFDLESQVGGRELVVTEGDGKPGWVDAGVEVADQSDVVCRLRLGTIAMLGMTRLKGKWGRGRR